MTDQDLQGTLARSELSACDKATVILWSEAQNGSPGLTVYGLSKKMTTLRVGNPNRAQLERDLRKSHDVIKVGERFAIRSGRTAHVRKLINDAGDKPVVDLSSAFIAEQIWRGTRNYIEKVAIQLCGCWEQHFYDAAAVMLRRLAETLVIEAYESLRRDDDIKDPSGNYFMFGTLVDRACGPSGINLGREAKVGLKEIKEQGDRSAHNRRINAVRPELEQVRSKARVLVEELINIARLKERGEIEWPIHA